MNTVRTRNDAALLVDYAARLARHTEGRRAAHLHLSRLRPHNRREHHVLIALDCFDPLIKKFAGEIFLLDDDIVFVCKGATVSEIDDVVLKLRVLFREDPLARDDEGEGQVFCTWYDLEKEYDQFKAMAQRAQATPAPALAGPWSSHPDGDDEALEGPGRPLDPEMLGKLEQALATMDLATLVRRRPVCVLTPERPPVPVFSEVYVSLAELRRALMPDVDLRADRWLYKRLCEILARRLLALLPKLEGRNPGATSMGSDVRTVLSQEFLDFDTRIRAATTKALIVELDVIDVFADMASYAFAREFLHERKYRVCLDGVCAQVFPVIDRKRFGFDMVKVRWAPGMNDGAGGAGHDDLGEVVALASASRVVLAGCDDEEAVALGHSLGITMYQGPHVDALLRGSVLKAAS